MYEYLIQLRYNQLNILNLILAELYSLGLGLESSLWFAVCSGRVMC